MEKTLWFKAKRYGWGWYPSNLQGFLVIIIYVALLVESFHIINNNFHSTSSTLFIFLPLLFLLSVLLIIICYLKGEKPSWNWGTK